MLAPGGTLLFAGEPSRYGDRLANVPKRAAGTVAPLWRRAIGARPAPPADGGAPDSALEGVVDVHAFAPGELSGFAEGAGFADVRVTGEELLANWFGWTNRTLEATADPVDVPWAWRQYAYRGYLLFQELDRRLLESRLPPAIFYNLMLAARKPASGRSRTGERAWTLRHWPPIRALTPLLRQVTDLLGGLQHEQRQFVKHLRLSRRVVAEAHRPVFVAQAVAEHRPRPRRQRRGVRRPVRAVLPGSPAPGSAAGRSVSASARRCSARRLLR